MSMGDDTQLCELLTRYVAGDCSAEEVRELSARLEWDVVACDLLAEILLQAGAVREYAQTTADYRAKSALPLPTKSFSRVIAAAAAMVFAAVIWIQGGRDEAWVMRATEVSGSVRWIGQGGNILDSLAKDAALGGGTVETLSDDAAVTLAFRDGSLITLMAHSAATISDDGQKQVHLREGNLSADVRPQKSGKPLLIHTTTAVLEVLGTRFEVDSDSANTRLIVNEGRVRMTRLVDGRVAEVTAEHEVIASLDPAEDFQGTPRRTPEVIWSSDLARGGDGAQGHWLPADTTRPPRLSAEPVFLKNTSRGAVTIHRVAVMLQWQELKTVQVRPESRLRITGRSKVAAPLELMLLGRKPEGGHAGNFFREIEVRPGSWQIEATVGDFRKGSANTTHSPPPAMNLRHIAIYTINTDAELEIESVEVLRDLHAFTGPRWIANPKYDAKTAPRFFLDKIEVEGPLPKEWPPASHLALGLAEATPQDENGFRAVFAKLLPRAYRRPVEDAEVDRLVQIATKGMLEEKLDFHAALRIGLQTMLVSPGFVFLQEPKTTAKLASRSLTDHELASRLSYFLWSSMPDDALFALAAKGGLRQPATLRAQVKRMLADPKSRRFVENFAGQWLDVEQFGSVEPAKEYKNYDADLKTAGKEEPLAFFQHVLGENLPATNFLDSDFLVINERLARHYDIEGVTGEAFQKVALRPENHRGGVLGMAGLMTLLGDGTRTLPVRRGAWVLEKLLNDPPPPPPPNAGDIQPNTAGAKLTVRERLQKHRDEPNCASCHAKLDPYGLALENYDAIGRWREQQNGEGISGPKAPGIDASGALKSGLEFSDLAGYKAALLAEKDKFIRAFTEKLLTYALGRPVGYVDHATLEQITTSAAKSGHRLQDLIQDVVSSEPFQTK